MKETTLVVPISFGLSDAARFEGYSWPAPKSEFDHQFIAERQCKLYSENVPFLAK